MTGKVQVQFYGRCKEGHGNIIWRIASPRRRGGKFLPPHPCHENPTPVVFSREDQQASADPLGKFRALGYYASCFPEGDGIAFHPPDDKTPEQVVEDVRQCFAFDVKVERL